MYYFKIINAGVATLEKELFEFRCSQLTLPLVAAPLIPSTSGYSSSEAVLAGMAQQSSSKHSAGNFYPPTNYYGEDSNRYAHQPFQPEQYRKNDDSSYPNSMLPLLTKYEGSNASLFLFYLIKKFSIDL